ncbi:MAG: hypothetical protein AAF600_13985 [Bacteroidota bacterium]
MITKYQEKDHLKNGKINTEELFERFIEKDSGHPTDDFRMDRFYREMHSSLGKGQEYYSVS